MRNTLILSSLLFLLLTFHFLPKAPSLEPTPDEASIVPLSEKTNSNESIFPEKCLGNWEGTLYIYKFNKVQDSLKATFTVAKTEVPGTYTWKTEYLTPERTIVKDYKLVVDNLEEGRYILDEGDGIELMAYHVQNKLYSLFKLKDIYLTASTELTGDQLVFEVTSGKEYNITGQEIANFSFTNVQRAVYHKVE